MLTIPALKGRRSCCLGVCNRCYIVAVTSVWFYNNTLSEIILTLTLNEMGLKLKQFCCILSLLKHVGITVTLLRLISVSLDVDTIVTIAFFIFKCFSLFKILMTVLMGYSLKLVILSYTCTCKKSTCKKTWISITHELTENGFALILESCRLQPISIIHILELIQKDSMVTQNILKPYELFVYFPLASKIQS